MFNMSGSNNNNNNFYVYGYHDPFMGNQPSPNQPADPNVPIGPEQPPFVDPQYAEAGLLVILS